MKLYGIAAVLSAGTLFVACAAEEAPANMNPDRSEAFGALQEAIVAYPRFVDVQSKIIAKTCSPNPGVCHHNAEYPDLRSLADLAAQVNANCNPRMIDPTQGWDSCEQHPDRITDGIFVSEIGWREKRGPGEWAFGLKDPLPESLGAITIESFERELVLAPVDSWSVSTAYDVGARELTIGIEADSAAISLADSVLESVVEGDPNRNGVWGASDDSVETAKMLFPGNLSGSYLWRRILGDVPGSRMPLANAPLTNADYLALGCLIEGLRLGEAPDVTATIDYSSCSFFSEPELFAVPAQ